LVIAALFYTWVESKVSNQFVAITKAADVANGGAQPIEGDEANAAESSQTQKLWLIQNLLRHVTAQLAPAQSRCD
jgi:hypothetical protein